jgi:hypothetical protein
VYVTNHARAGQFEEWGRNDDDDSFNHHGFAEFVEHAGRWKGIGPRASRRGREEANMTGRGNGLRVGLVVIALAALAGLSGCRSTTTVRSGASGVESAASTPSPRGESVLETVAKAKRDPSPEVVPASWSDTSTSNCQH